VKTGIAYFVPLKVNRFDNVLESQAGNPSPGYPRVYNPLDAFGEYSAITAAELALMSVEDAKKRFEAFLQYVREKENTADLGEVNSYIDYAPSDCPVDSALSVIMTAIAELDGHPTPDELKAQFTVDGTASEYSGPLDVAVGAKISLSTGDSSGGGIYFFDGWYDAAEPSLRISSNREYDFVIARETTMLARWKLSGTGGLVLLLVKGAYITDVEGGGSFAYGTTVTAKAITPDDAVFAGWYEAGDLVSALSEYTFILTKYTELEARAIRDNEYVFIADKQNLSVNPQQGSFAEITVRSHNNGVPVTFAADAETVPDWITGVEIVHKSSGGSEYSVKFTVNENTGNARNRNIALVQGDSGKRIVVNIQQQKSAGTPEYYWKPNDSEIAKLINDWKSKHPNWIINFLGYVGDSFDDAVPDAPCTEQDYVSKNVNSKKLYTIRISNIPQPVQSVYCWFDAEIRT
jgi:hypothetical protein